MWVDDLMNHDEHWFVGGNLEFLFVWPSSELLQFGKYFSTYIKYLIITQYGLNSITRFILHGTKQRSVSRGINRFIEISTSNSSYLSIMRGCSSTVVYSVTILHCGNGRGNFWYSHIAPTKNYSYGILRNFIKKIIKKIN